MSSRVRTPNYVLSEPFIYSVYGHGPMDSRTLEAGTFVRPIELYYVPKHVTEDPQNRGFDKAKEVYCYCHFGIIPIPRKIIREAT